VVKSIYPLGIISRREGIPSKARALVELAFIKGKARREGDKQPVTAKEFKKMFGFIPKHGLMNRIG